MRIQINFKVTLIFLFNFTLYICAQKSNAFNGIIAIEDCAKKNAFFCAKEKSCIPLDWLTDGEADCTDGADETAAAAEFLETHAISIAPKDTILKEEPQTLPTLVEVKIVYKFKVKKFIKWPTYMAYLLDNS